MKTSKIPASRILFLNLVLAVVAVLSLTAPAASFAAKKDKAANSAAASVDINSADEKTIAALPGVGKKTAKDIIAGRPYKSLDDLKRVKGMNDARLKQVAGKITFGASATAAPAETAQAPKVGHTARPPKAEKGAAASAKLAPGEKVNINTASKDQLDKLPGIGDVKAQAIIDNRPYSKPEDIMKVKGIKEKQYEKIKDMITVK